jgi:hypothetical protein
MPNSLFRGVERVKKEGGEPEADWYSNQSIITHFSGPETEWITS